MKTKVEIKTQVELLNVGKKVAVGLSGGVDSAVSAVLLKRAGFDVVAVNMKCWSNADGSECEADKDRKIAVQVAEKIGIPIKIWDFEKEYREKVIKYFFSEIKKGRTPNPDIICNKEIKFEMFLNKALSELGVDYIATGHYARIISENNSYKLLKGVDVTKDQSYFLYALNQHQLSKTLFPVGHLTKKEVRELAEEFQLPNKNKKDSVGICFIGEVDITEFLKKHISEKIGVVKNIKGEVIGEHIGVWFYTIGQRHGFTINTYQGKPLFVVRKDVENNELIVGDAIDTDCNQFEIEDTCFVFKGAKELLEKGDVDVRIRHLGRLTASRVSNNIVKSLKGNFHGVASGQSAVFYDDDIVLGGAVIK